MQVISAAWFQVSLVVEQDIRTGYQKVYSFLYWSCKDRIGKRAGSMYAKVVEAYQAYYFSHILNGGESVVVHMYDIVQTALKGACR